MINLYYFYLDEGKPLFEKKKPVNFHKRNAFKCINAPNDHVAKLVYAAHLKIKN